MLPLEHPPYQTELLSDAQLAAVIARFYDKVRRKQRADVPGLHETVLHAALALARAKQMVADAIENGEMIPSHMKRKRRRGSAPLPAAIAIQLGAACLQLPLALVQPL